MAGNTRGAEVGLEFQHEHSGRHGAETDNLLFTALTLNPQPLHLGRRVRQTQHVRPHPRQQHLYVGAGGWALSVRDTTLGTTLGNLGFRRDHLSEPVFIGDTIRARSTVVARRVSRSKPDRGIVTFEHIGTNQRAPKSSVRANAAR